MGLFGRSPRTGGGRAGQRIRIEHPHLVEDADYECSVCRWRFSKDTMTCPRCGTVFDGKRTDYEEFEDEEEEMEAWDEEEGL